LISGFFSGGSPAGGFFLLGDSSEAGGSFIGDLRRAGGLTGGFFGSCGGSSRGVFDGSEGLFFFAAVRLLTARLTGVSINHSPDSSRIQDQNIDCRRRNKAGPASRPTVYSRARLQRDRAFVFVAKEAAITEAGTAVRTIEFVGVQNLIPTFCAFDTAIDQLEHLILPSLR
jgi:hypothetical protein